MTQPFADALTWMPKSRALGATLTRAHDIARAQGHPSVLLEHLLQALIEDPDASAVLLHCNIDLLNLNAAVTSHLQSQPVSGSSQPSASQPLLQILEYASAAARQSKRSEVNGAIVLAAMAGEGKSDAARMLQTAGLKFEDTIIALRRSAAPRPAPAEAATAQAPQQQQSLPQPPAPPSESAQAANPPHVHATSEPVPASVAEPALSAPQPQPLHVQHAADEAKAPSQLVMDEDPLTTARRRVAALRSGSPPSNTNGASHPDKADAVQTAALVAPALPAVHAKAASGAATAAVAVAADSQAWAPPPQPSPAASNVRTMRMPPPIPPITARPPQRTVTPTAQGGEARAVQQLRAPWSNPEAENAEAAHVQPQNVPAASFTGEPIDPKRLGEGIPYRMQERVPVTIEVRIARSAVLATAAAMRAGARDNRDTALTRAVSVRVRAPSGGFYVETAAPETQWFDSRMTPPRDEDEVRWRWVVTPQLSGTKPLQVSVTIRTIAADGTVIETALPEHQCSIRVGSNYREGIRRLGRAAIAVSAGVAVTLLATGGLASVFGAIFK